MQPEVQFHGRRPDVLNPLPPPLNFSCVASSGGATLSGKFSHVGCPKSLISQLQLGKKNGIHPLSAIKF